MLLYSTTFLQQVAELSLFLGFKVSIKKDTIYSTTRGSTSPLRTTALDVRTCDISELSSSTCFSLFVRPLDDKSNQLDEPCVSRSHLEPRSASVPLSSTLLRLCSASVSSGTSSSSSSRWSDSR